MRKKKITNTMEVPGADCGWAHGELGGIELGDARVERRLQRVAEELSQQPEYPINQASEDAAATKAAYRLFGNDRVTAEKILSAHRARTMRRMWDEPIILAIQDTCFFNFSGHKKTRGLGPIGDKVSNALGLIVHHTLTVTPRGLPLGELTHQCWARLGHHNTEYKCEDKPIEEKESYRWVEALRETAELAASHKRSLVVTIADRESDIYEFLHEAQELNAKYVIRAGYDRHIQSQEYRTIHEHLDAIQSQGQVEIDVPTQKRKATLALKFTSVQLRPPERITKSKKALRVTCWIVHVKEITPPKNCDPLSWTLLTNIPVDSIEQAVEKLAWYKRRWSIEEFHKILKSGCIVEDCRLQTAERLKRYLALFSVIAWRIFWLVHISRADPKAPAEVALTQTEIGTIQSLKRFKDSLPLNTALTVKKALLAIACLGGYLNRKNDPPPGPTVVWRGWQRLSSMAELYESMATGCG